MIEGTLVLEQAQGARTTPHDALLVFAAVSEDAKPLETTIRDGRFRVELPPDRGDFEIGPIRAGGETDWSGPSGSRNALPAHVELVAHPVIHSFLRFVEAESGLDLPFVDIATPDHDPLRPPTL